MRTTARLSATINAIAHHRSANGNPVNQHRRIAAKVAELACPLGKLLVDGVRMSNLWSPDVVGRVRLKSRLMPWLTIRLSKPRPTDSASASCTRCMLPMERAHAHTCHTMLKSPTVDAKPNSVTDAFLLRSGSRSASARESNVVTSVPEPRELRLPRGMGRHRIRDTTSDSDSSCTVLICSV